MSDRVDKIVDELITDKLQLKHSPQLVNNVMRSVERVERNRRVLFNFTLISGVAAALIVALFLGSRELLPSTDNSTILTLNDTQIEQLHFYSFEE